MLHALLAAGLHDETKRSAVTFMKAATTFFVIQGVTIKRIHEPQRHGLPQPGFRGLSTAADSRHVRTRPFTPRTNGKAKRFIQPSTSGTDGRHI